MLRKLTQSFILIALMALPLSAGSFVAASDTDPVIGRYLVSLDVQTAGDDDRAVIDALATTYGARLEPFARSGFRGFVAVMLPSRARLLAADRHVLRVEELAATEVSPAATKPHAAVRPFTPVSQWTEHDATTSWDSGIYRYDGAGNIAAAGSDQYAYDGANRLVQGSTHAHGVATTQTFQYDRYGNLSSVDSSVVRPGAAPVTTVQSVTIDAATNRISQACADGQCAPWNYDAAGNQTTLEGATLRWDAVGSMTDLESGSLHERYVYDAGDERIAVVSMSGTSEVVRRWTLRDPSNKVARAAVQDVASDTWSGVEDYIYRNGKLLAAFDAGVQSVPNRHYHLDHLGTPRMITDSLRRKLAVDFYLPFGAEAPGQERQYAGLDERARFTGHERDGAGNSLRPPLDYMHARYYSMGWGRFTSMDPGRDWDASIPRTWNLYSYVRNNPVGNIDPTGRASAPAAPFGQWIYSQGPSASITVNHKTLGVAFNENFDGTGNASLTISTFGGFSTSEADMSLMATGTLTPGQNVENLEGGSVTVGLSTWLAGADAGFNGTTGKLESGSFSFNVLAPFTEVAAEVKSTPEVHVNAQQTVEIFNGRESATKLGTAIGTKIREYRDTYQEIRQLFGRIDALTPSQ